MAFSNDSKIVSCAADGIILFRDLEKNAESKFACHLDMTFEVVPDSNNRHVFLSCSEDGTVRQYDLRAKDSCLCRGCQANVIADVSTGVSAIALHPVNPTYFSISCGDGLVRTFDRRMASGELVYKFCPSHLYRKDSTHKTTSLKYSHDGRQMVVSYSGEYIYVIEPGLNRPLQERYAWRSKLPAIDEEHHVRSDSNRRGRTSSLPQFPPNTTGFYMRDLQGGPMVTVQMPLEALQGQRAGPGENPFSQATFIQFEESSADEPGIDETTSNSSTDERDLEQQTNSSSASNSIAVETANNQGATIAGTAEHADYDQDVVMVFRGHRNVRTMVCIASFLFVLAYAFYSRSKRPTFMVNLANTS